MTARHLAILPSWAENGTECSSAPSIRSRLGTCLAALMWVVGTPVDAALPTIQTPFGSIAVDKGFQLQLNGLALSNPFTEEPFLPHETVAHVAGPWNAILLSGNQAPNCLQFQWLLLAQDRVSWTPVFGTCDTKIQVSVSGDELTLSMRTQVERKRRKPVTFVLKGEQFVQKEKFTDQPKGYIHWPE